MWQINERPDVAASMIAELAGATVRIVSAGQFDTSDVEVSSTLADVNRVLGTDLLMPMSACLRRLGFGLSGNAESYCQRPRRRWDIITIEGPSANFVSDLRL